MCIRDRTDSGPDGGNWTAVGEMLVVVNAGGISGVWEVTEAGDASGNIRVKRTPMNQGFDTGLLSGFGSAPTEQILNTDYLMSLRHKAIVINHYGANTLYGDQEGYDVPLTRMQAQALICYIKGALAEEGGDLERKLYYDKQYKTKMSRQRTARVTGPRMVSPGPHALR